MLQFLQLAIRFQSIITDLFTGLGEAATGVIDVIVDIFTGVVQVFYAAPGGTGDKVLTVYGYLLLISAAVGMVWKILAYFTNLAKMRG